MIIQILVESSCNFGFKVEVLAVRRIFAGITGTLVGTVVLEQRELSFERRTPVDLVGRVAQQHAFGRGSECVRSTVNVVDLRSVRPLHTSVIFVVVLIVDVV